MFSLRQNLIGFAQKGFFLGKASLRTTGIENTKVRDVHFVGFLGRRYLLGGEPLAPRESPW